MHVLFAATWHEERFESFLAQLENDLYDHGSLAIVDDSILLGFVVSQPTFDHWLKGKSLTMKKLFKAVTPYIGRRAKEFLSDLFIERDTATVIDLRFRERIIGYIVSEIGVDSYLQEVLTQPSADPVLPTSS